MVAAFDMNPIAYHKSNITKDKAVAAFDPNTIEHLQRFHSYDAILHRFVRDQWQKYKVYMTRPTEKTDDDAQFVYVPQSYDAARTAYMIDARTVKILQNGGVQVPLGRPLVQKKPDLRSVHP